ncbi:hypothetical protein D918_03661 [Trichuris suis]|nr:hypothetical protein D918_03661 [Trichuris suis]
MWLARGGESGQPRVPKGGTMNEQATSVGDSFVVVGGENTVQSGSNLGETNVTNFINNEVLAGGSTAGDSGAVALTMASQAPVSSGAKTGFDLTSDLTKAIATLWQRQPEMVMPSPGPAMMPGLTEFANQKGMKNGDGRYTDMAKRHCMG